MRSRLRRIERTELSRIGEALSRMLAAAPSPQAARAQPALHRRGLHRLRRDRVLARARRGARRVTARARHPRAQNLQKLRVRQRAGRRRGGLGERRARRAERAPFAGRRSQLGRHRARRLSQRRALQPSAGEGRSFLHSRDLRDRFGAAWIAPVRTTPIAPTTTPFRLATKTTAATTIRAATTTCWTSSSRNTSSATARAAMSWK